VGQLPPPLPTAGTRPIPAQTAPRPTPPPLGSQGRRAGIAVVLSLAILAVVGGTWFALGLGEAATPIGQGKPANQRRARFVYRPAQLAGLDPARIVQHPRLHAPLVKDQVLVSLHRGVSEQDFHKVLAGLDIPVRIVGRIPSFRMLQLEVPADKLAAVRQRLANHPYVAAAGFNFVYARAKTFNDPALADGNPQGWGIRRIRAPEAWDLSTGSDSAVIGIVDSGSQVDHEELAGKVVSPYSYATGSAQMQELSFFQNGQKDFVTGHGTHVAITAGGIANNGRGTAGIAPDCPVMPIQVLQYNPQQNNVLGSTADIVDGIARAMGAGAQVINLSLGPNYQGTALDREYRSATPERQRQLEQEALPGLNAELESYRPVLDQAQASGVILVKAAGNNNLPAFFDPLSYSRRVISVAATTPADGRASFSNYGDYTVVSAPGTAIYSGYPDPERPYTEMQGTSMAAPHVSGVVALMKSLKPDLTFEEVRDILRATGQALSTDLPIGPLVDARAALEEVQRRVQNPVPPPPSEPPLILQPPELPPEGPRDPGQILDGPTPWIYLEVQWYIDLWLFIALPPGNGIEAWFYDRWGRAVNRITVFTVRPPNLAGMSRYQWIWRSARTLPSTRYGTLEGFVRIMVQRGGFNPAPAPLYSTPRQNQKGGGDNNKRSTDGKNPNKQPTGGGEPKKQASGGGNPNKRPPDGREPNKRNTGGRDPKKQHTGGGNPNKRPPYGGNPNKRDTGGGDPKKQHTGHPNPAQVVTGTWVCNHGHTWVLQQHGTNVTGTRREKDNKVVVQVTGTINGANVVLRQGTACAGGAYHLVFSGTNVLKGTFTNTISKQSGPKVLIRK
jgi:hypothetical protein